MTENALIEIQGPVQNIIFKNDQNAYTVLEMLVEDELITAVGTIPLVVVGEELKLSGFYKTHPSFGLQFKISSFEKFLPTSSDAILKYLSSGAIKGLGPVYASRIVDLFGEDTFEIIEKHPEKLCDIKGITKSKAKKISEEFINLFGIKELIAYLQKYSISPEESVRAWKTFGKNSIDIIKADPYSLCRDPINIDFERADEISFSLAYEKDDQFRIRAGIMHVLLHNTNNGHTCLPLDKLIIATAQFLEVSIDQVSEIITIMKDDKKIITDIIDEKEFVFSNEMYIKETYSATRLLLMLNFPPKSINGVKEDILEIEKNKDISYADLQKKAINDALTKGILVLTGGPGTGKTTTLNAIIRILNKNKQKVYLAAPTGRAAQRMTQLTGVEAKTIHRMLEVGWDAEDKPTFRRNEQNLLKCDALVLDEMSMVDSNLFESVLRALPLGCRLIMVGDTDQLPSVGPGNVLGDLISSSQLPVVQLKEIFRQSMESLIVTNAHKIVSGEMPDLYIKNKDFFFLNSKSADQVLETIVDLCKRRLPNSYQYSPLFDIQILCPSRKGMLGTTNFNKVLQDELNPDSITKQEINIIGKTLREGDKVIQSKNNYDISFHKDNGEVGEGIFNGDVGILEKIDRKSSSLQVRFDDKVAIYTFEDALNLDLAYAITVHKSQGNEFECVLMPILGGSPQLNYRNLLYTAVTRAKSLLILNGSEKTIEAMINNNRKAKRYSALSKFLIRGSENND